MRATGSAPESYSEALKLLAPSNAGIRVVTPEEEEAAIVHAKAELVAGEAKANRLKVEEVLTAEQVAYLASVHTHVTPAAAPSVLSTSTEHIIAHSATAAAPPSSETPQYFIRVLYNGKPLILPVSSNKSEFIPLKDFHALVSKYVSVDFATECNGVNGVLPSMIPHLPPLPANFSKEELEVAFAQSSLPSKLLPGLSPEQVQEAKEMLSKTGEDISFDTLKADEDDLKEEAN
jgi:hypothetical protein